MRLLKNINKIYFLNQLCFEVSTERSVDENFNEKYCLFIRFFFQEDIILVQNSRVIVLYNCKFASYIYKILERDTHCAYVEDVIINCVACSYFDCDEIAST